MKTPLVEKPSESLVEMLTRLVATRAEGAFNFLVRSSGLGGVSLYTNLRIIHACSRVDWAPSMFAQSIHIVARGDDGQGPFVFIWPPYGVDPDQCACKGLPLEDISSSS